MSFSLPPAFINPARQTLRWPAYLFLLLFCIACFSPGLVTMPVTDRDEPRFAQASKQMIETGNYVDIRYQDEVRYKKPVGIYWLQATATRIFNRDNLNTIWSYRLPSQLGATIAVLMTAALGALLFGPLAGFIAGLLLASTLILNVEARLAKTDAMLLATVVMGQYALARTYLGVVGKASHAGWGTAFLFWTAQAIAFLIKGPILLLITLGTILVVKFWQPKGQAPLSPWAWLRQLRPWSGLPYALLLILPWFIAIMNLSDGHFARESAGHDLLSKLWQGQDRGFVPPGVHTLVFPFVYFPAALLVILALPDIWRNRHEPKIKFLLGWILPLWVILEIAFTKLPHYTLPVFPALAICAAKFFVDGYPNLSLDGKRRLSFVAGFIIFTLTVVFAIGTGMLDQQLNETLRLTTLIAALTLLLGMGGALALIAQKKIQGAIVLVITGAFFMAGTFGLFLPGLKNLWHSREIVAAARSFAPCPDSIIASSNYAEPSLVFQAGTKTQLLNSGTEVAQAMQTNACVLGLISAKSEAAFQQAYGEKKRPYSVAQFKGFNLGSGRVVDLTLYRSVQP